MSDASTIDQADESVWWIVGLCLVGAALSFLGAGIVQTYRFSGVGVRERIEEIVNFGLGTVTAGLLLGAAITLRAAGERARSLLTAVMV
jgi:RsiW-degrading membrane proteinase PrsW (M82 family)